MASLLTFNQHLFSPISQSFNVDDFLPFIYSQPTTTAVPLSSQQLQSQQLQSQQLQSQQLQLQQLQSQQLQSQQLQPQQLQSSHYKNSLFWSCYVIVNGYPPFGKPMLPIELKIKEEMCMFFRQNARILKDKRHRITLCEMEEIITDLMTISTKPQEYNSGFGVLRTNLAVCIAYAVYWKIHIYIACPIRHIFTSFLCNDENDTNTNCLLFLQGNSFVLYEEEDVNNEIQKMKQDYLELNNYKKPLYAISHYKTRELQEIIKQLDIIYDDGGTKINMYKTIETHCFTQKIQHKKV